MPFPHVESIQSCTVYVSIQGQYCDPIGTETNMAKKPSLHMDKKFQLEGSYLFSSGQCAVIMILSSICTCTVRGSGSNQKKRKVLRIRAFDFSP